MTSLKFSRYFDNFAEKLLNNKANSSLTVSKKYYLIEKYTGYYNKMKLFIIMTTMAATAATAAKQI
jgi:hypothetical protein